MYWLTAAPIKPMQYDTLIEVLENNDTVTIIKSAEELEEEESTLIPRAHSQKRIWVTYKVKKGDALFTLTDIFDCSAQQLRSWNRVRGNYLSVGKTLKFYVLADKKAFYVKLNSLNLTEKRKVAEQD
jgi:LysM repeat protein